MRDFWTANCYDHDGAERELRCPKCSCPRLRFKGNVAGYTDAQMYFGMEAVCYECGHEFTVSENCWELTGECL